jgi:Protein of unknown function (DUF1573)
MIKLCQSSCGCIIPIWPKEPILPGHVSFIEVKYNTQGRPGPCNKTTTVVIEDGFILQRNSKNLSTDINLQQSNRCVLQIKCNVLLASKEEEATQKK